jgi:ABC-type histidine transport system ATPase subunit
MAMLEIEGLDVHYGGIHALRGVSLKVERGEIVTLIGANGAGKTTTLRAISGLIKPSAGVVRFDGQVITGVPPHAIVSRGLVHAPEGRVQQEQLVQRCLVNRLRFARDLARHPEILEEDVSDPIVVLGFPRSGTTVLQRMISADPAMQNLALWRVLNPAPLPDESPGQPLERIAIARATEQAIRTHNPALFTAHPMIAHEAEEALGELPESSYRSALGEAIGYVMDRRS